MVKGKPPCSAASHLWQWGQKDTSGERGWSVDKRYGWAQQGQALTQNAQPTVLQPSVGGEVGMRHLKPRALLPTPSQPIYTLSCSSASQSPTKHHSAGHSQRFVGFPWLPAQPPNSQQALLSLKKVYYIHMYRHTHMHAHTQSLKLFLSSF